MEIQNIYEYQELFSQSRLQIGIQVMWYCDMYVIELSHSHSTINPEPHSLTATSGQSGQSGALLFI
jgi:hypothetical protein